MGKARGGKRRVLSLDKRALSPFSQAPREQNSSCPSQEDQLLFMSVWRGYCRFIHLGSPPPPAGEGVGSVCLEARVFLKAQKALAPRTQVHPAHT